MSWVEFLRFTLELLWKLYFSSLTLSKHFIWYNSNILFLEFNNGSTYLSTRYYCRVHYILHPMSRVVCLITTIHLCVFSILQRTSWKNLFAYMGPGFLVSIAYIDPGNCKIRSHFSWFSSVATLIKVNNKLT